MAYNYNHRNEGRTSLTEYILKDVEGQSKLFGDCSPQVVFLCCNIDTCKWIHDTTYGCCENQKRGYAHTCLKGRACY